MDGNSDIQSQVRLMRSVIGRKIMEIDEFNEKAAAAVGDEAVMYANLVNFLEHDVDGYKTIIDDLKDGSCDYTGDLYEIASLPAESLDLYNDFYVPSLTPEDRADESAAMDLKGQYAIDFVNKYTAQLGRAALASQVAVDIMMADEAVARAIGAIVAGNPELLNAVAPEKERTRRPRRGFGPSAYILIRFRPALGRPALSASSTSVSFVGQRGDGAVVSESTAISLHFPELQ